MEALTSASQQVCLTPLLPECMFGHCVAWHARIRRLCLDLPLSSVSASSGPGGSIDNGVYWACITSYDYDAPISEAGDYGQPGIGGPNKFQVRAGFRPCAPASGPDRLCQA